MKNDWPTILAEAEAAQKKGVNFKRFAEERGINPGTLYAKRRDIKRRASKKVFQTGTPKFVQFAPVAEAQITVNYKDLKISVSRDDVRGLKNVLTTIKEIYESI